MSVGSNSTEGISNGTTVTTGNSGGLSGDAWDTVTIGTSGAIVSDNAHPAHGAQAHKFSTGGTSATVFVAKTVTAKPTYYARSSPFTWSSFSLNPTLARFRSGGGATDVGRIRVSSTGKLQILNAAASAVATSTTTLTTGTQYRVEYFFTQGASSTAEVKLFTGVDDALSAAVETLTATGQNFGTADIDTIQFGQVAAATNLPALWLDDMAWSDIGYLGPAQMWTTQPLLVLIRPPWLQNPTPLVLRGSLVDPAPAMPTLIVPAAPRPFTPSVLQVLRNTLVDPATPRPPLVVPVLPVPTAPTVLQVQRGTLLDSAPAAGPVVVAGQPQTVSAPLSLVLRGSLADLAPDRLPPAPVLVLAGAPSLGGQVLVGRAPIGDTDDCETPRPNIGTTVYVFAGTARPDSGTTSDPC